MKSSVVGRSLRATLFRLLFASLAVGCGGDVHYAYLCQVLTEDENGFERRNYTCEETVCHAGSKPFREYANDDEIAEGYEPDDYLAICQEDATLSLDWRGNESISAHDRDEDGVGYSEDDDDDDPAVGKPGGSDDTGGGSSGSGSSSSGGIAGYPFKVKCSSGTESTINIPSGSSSCQKTYEQYAQACSCNVVDVCMSLQSAFEACAATP